MRRFLKWLLVSLSIIFSGLVFFGAILSAILYHTLPDDDASVALSGLNSSVETIYDVNGVPHIEAEKLEDAMQVLGYVHARDRLWQMEFLRRVGQGRLSEVLGEKTVKTDVFLRTLDMQSAAKSSYEKLLPETKTALISYAKGVNAYINRPTKLFETGLGVEFLVLGHKPEPWEAWNSALILKVMGLTLSKNMNTEIQRLALASKGFSSREIDEIIPYGPRDNPPPLPDLRALYGFPEGGKPQDAAALDAASEQQHAYNGSTFEWPTGRSASNNWVISGTRTVSGKPILANDPHLGFTAPSVFYMAHVSWNRDGAKNSVVGGTIPGIPFPVAGRNLNVAWGLTTTNDDGQDLFIEQINPEDANSYKTPEGWAAFEEGEIEILVSGKEPVSVKRRLSRNGVVLPKGFRDLERYLPKDTVAVLRWTGLAADDTSLDTLFKNGVAKNVDEVFEGMKRAVSPMQSVVVADIEGNIGLATPGRLPKRKSDNLVMGRAPVPGWVEQYQWEAQIDSVDVPTFQNTEKGAYTTANANFFPKDYPHHVTFDWAEHFRQARAEKRVLDRNSPHDVAASQKIMADDFSEPLLALIKLAARQAKSGAGRAGSVLQGMVRWDGRMRADRAEPLIALALFKHLHENILKDDFGDAYVLFDRGRITRLLGILERGTQRQWCDDQTTSQTERCGDIIIKSLNEALADLESRHGENWRDWRYGDEHFAFSEHRPFSSVGVLADYFDIKVPQSGGPYTLLRGQTLFGKDKPYSSRHGAAYRAVYDFENLENSKFMISTGQSGNFLSPHYSDLSKLWSRSEFIEIPTDREKYIENKTGTWVFESK